MTTVVERTETTRPVSRLRMLAVVGVLLVLGAVVVAGLYVTVPKGNEGSGPVDVILVLGTPADLHGELTQMQQWRADEGIREFRAGLAPRLLFSGGPTSHSYVEADVMARYAREQGVPGAAIFKERQARTTLQNIANSAQLMADHGWHSVEVVSTAEHLPRAAVLLEKTDLAWRVHVAPTPGRSHASFALAYAEEAFGTAMLRVFGRRAEPILHALAVTQHSVAYGFRWVVYKIKAHM